LKEGKESDFSFTTFKVDNVDFSKSDIRILNYKGEPDYEGRVEFRVDGKWGAVSSKNTDQNFARQFCKTLNYKDGFILNNDSESFCSSYKDQNWCGLSGTAIHYSHYTCDPRAGSLVECERYLDSDFSHANDLIVQCSEVDLADKRSNDPVEGAVRIMGKEKSPSLGKIGRVEIFLKNKWGTVCNVGWTSQSAEVACK
jgi:hypothetical protein